MNVILPIARWCAAALTAWLLATVTVPGVEPGELEAALTTLFLLVWSLFFAVAVWGLKLLTRRLGEQAPGDTPPATRDPHFP